MQKSIGCCIGLDMQVDEENQLLWATNKRGIGSARWEPRQVRLLVELVRSYELDQLIERAAAARV